MFTNKQVVNAAAGCSIMIGLNVLTTPKNNQARKVVTNIVLAALIAKFVENIAEDYKDSNTVIKTSTLNQEDEYQKDSDSDMDFFSEEAKGEFKRLEEEMSSPKSQAIYKKLKEEMESDPFFNDDTILDVKLK